MIQYLRGKKKRTRKQTYHQIASTNVINEHDVEHIAWHGVRGVLWSCEMRWKRSNLDVEVAARAVCRGRVEADHAERVVNALEWVLLADVGRDVRVGVLEMQDVVVDPDLHAQKGRHRRETKRERMSEGEIERKETERGWRESIGRERKRTRGERKRDRNKEERNEREKRERESSRPAPRP